MAKGKKVYAVRKGKKVGIFNTWAECESYVRGYPGAEYKSFKTMGEAKTYMSGPKSYTKTDSTKTGTSEIAIPETDMEAYVDGSYDQHNKVYGSGAVIFHEDKKINLSQMGKEPDLVEMRNVAGEIEAAKIAMIYAKEQGVKSIAIYHDYEGIAKWALGQWKTNKIGTQKYASFYKEISKELKVVFVKVKAHAGDQYNEEADQLAKKAIGLL